MKKYGFDAHTVEIVEVLSDYSKAVEKEIYYIKLFNSFSGDSKKGMNLTRGGEGPLGRKMSEKTKRILKEIHTGKKVSQETRERMSASRKGKSSWNKGIQHSDGAKQKMSTAKLGRKLSEEHIQNLAKAHFKKVDIYDNKNVLIKTCCSVIETSRTVKRNFSDMVPGIETIASSPSQVLHT